jgi:hypothetical protein
MSAIAATLVPEALAEPCQLGAVDDGPPAPAGVALADVELDRVGPDVDDREASWSGVGEGGKAPRIAGVGLAVQAKAADGGHDGGRVLGLDRGGPRGSAVHLQVGDLGQAATEGVADAPLVDPHNPHHIARLHQLGEELVQAVGVPGQQGWEDAEGVEHPGHLGHRQREARLQHRLPPLQAIAVDLPQELDVHEAAADLDIAAGRRQQIDLVALHNRPRDRSGQGHLCRPEARAEDTPFPPRDDPSHGRTPTGHHRICS